MAANASYAVAVISTMAGCADQRSIELAHLAVARLGTRRLDRAGQPTGPDRGPGRGWRSARHGSVSRSPGEVMEDVARRDDAGRAPVLDDRDVTEATSTAILWMATAIGSSWRSTTAGVMKSRTWNECICLPAAFTTASRSVKIPTRPSSATTRRSRPRPRASERWRRRSAYRGRP